MASNRVSGSASPDGASSLAGLPPATIPDPSHSGHGSTTAGSPSWSVHRPLPSQNPHADCPLARVFTVSPPFACQYSPRPWRRQGKGLVSHSALSFGGLTAPQ